MAIALTQPFFTQDPACPAKARPCVKHVPRDAGVSQGVAMFGGTMYEQMSLLTIHFLRVPQFPAPIVLPGAAGCMEQGTETGAWTSVHSTWEPDQDEPEGLEP
eukprot:14897113-Heterocapsa_arctica.AAC.1